MNTWAVAAVRYTAGIVDWTVDELKEDYRQENKKAYDDELGATPEGRCG